jgi:phage-related protein/predicted XRE-type DNA-binding protein
VAEHTRNVYTSNKKSDDFGPAGNPALAPFVFQGDSRRALRGFPKGIRHDLGYALYRLQLGQIPPDRKAVPTVGTGVYELREEDAKTWYRILYVRRAGTIQVLHCFEKRSNRIEQILRPQRHASSAYWKPNMRTREMSNKRSARDEYRVRGSVLDELGLDRQGALELKLKAALHQKILQLVKRRRHTARDLERILQIQQPRVSELMRGKISTLSVARLLLYADLLGAEAEVKLRRAKAHAAA